MVLGRAAIQSTIVSKLQAVSGVENVYDDMTRVRDIEDIVAKIIEDDESFVQFWRVRRTASIAQQSGIRGTTSCTTTYTHQFDIQLFWGWRENGEDDFQAIIDLVLENLVDQRTMDGTGFGMDPPISLNRVSDEVRYGVEGSTAYFTLTISEVLDVTNT